MTLQKSVEMKTGEIMMNRQSLLNNPVVRNMMTLDAHTKSILMDYAKQSVLRITSNVDKEIHIPFCPDFTELLSQMGVKVTPELLVKVGKEISKRYLRDFKKTPPKTLKYVAGAQRSVNTYPIENLEWLKSNLNCIVAV